MQITDVSQLATHFDIKSSSFHYVMSVMFQVHLQTNKDTTAPNTVILCWTLFAPCAVEFANCDAANILTKARVSEYTELTQRHKMKAPHIMFLS
jgi:hypothetical protein